MMELSPNLQFLKSTFESISTRRQETDIMVLYKSEILPHLLQLRRANRIDKNNLELKHSRIKDLSQKLASLQQSNENLMFEAACLGTSANITKDLVIADEELQKLDHPGRMKYLDEEEERRKDLQKRLSQLVDEMKELEKLYSQSAEQFGQVKPYVKQLLEITRTKLCGNLVNKPLLTPNS